MKNVMRSGFGFFIVITVAVAIVFIILITYYLFFKQPYQKSFLPNTTKNITERKNIPYGPDGSYQQFDSFMPNGYKKATPAVIFVHGGSWDSGDKAGLDPEARAVASIGWAGFSINYRLNGFPNEPEDVLSAIEWIKNHAAAFNVNPDKIAVLGTSAGGNLAAEAVTEAKNRLGHTSGVAAVVTWSGPMDLRSGHVPANVATIVEKYIGCNQTSCPEKYALASPITHVSSDDPPMLLVNSTEEIVPLDQAQSMATDMRNAGVTAQLHVIQGQLHAVAYAPQAFVPSIDFLSNFLGPVNGSMPSVPAGSQGLNN